MSRRKEIAMVTAGILAGIAISGPAAQAAAGLMANPSNQKFYLNNHRISLTAYEIGGSNYVKLRDIGEAVDFGVTYDAATNTVTISPDKPYETEVTKPASTAPAISQTSPSAQNKNADGSINIPQDGSRYVPQAGDMIRCDDGTNYTITDVSRYDKNYFADGPVGPLPTATCDWSRFDQPELPKANVAPSAPILRRLYHADDRKRPFLVPLLSFRCFQYIHLSNLCRAKVLEGTKNLDVIRAEEYTVATWLKTWYDLYSKPNVRLATANRHQLMIETYTILYHPQDQQNQALQTHLTRPPEALQGPHGKRAYPCWERPTPRPEQHHGLQCPPHAPLRL